jgi:hypothetical protein
MALPIDIIVDDALVGRLARRFRDFPDAVEKALRDFGLTAKKTIQGVTPVGEDIKSNRRTGRKGRRGGTAKKSWSIGSVEYRDGAWSIPIENTATSPDGFPYPVVLEFGSIPGSRPWPRPARRTTFGIYEDTGEQRVFSRQAVGGITHRAFQRIDINLFFNAIMRTLDSA